VNPDFRPDSDGRWLRHTWASPLHKAPRLCSRRSASSLFLGKGFEVGKRGGGLIQTCTNADEFPSHHAPARGGGGGWSRVQSISLSPLDENHLQIITVSPHIHNHHADNTHTLSLKNRRNTHISFVFFPRSKVARTPLHSRRGQFSLRTRFFASMPIFELIRCDSFSRFFYHRSVRQLNHTDFFVNSRIFFFSFCNQTTILTNHKPRKNKVRRHASYTTSRSSSLSRPRFPLLFTMSANDPTFRFDYYVIIVHCSLNIFKGVFVPILCNVLVYWNLLPLHRVAENI